MDTELARTFLEIVRTGSFVRAAERLHVSQTTVSARIKTLEERLGAPLFVRSKSGAALTRQGEVFLDYAPTLVQLWERARNRIEVPQGHESVLAVGCEPALWDPLLLDWLLRMRRTVPRVAVRVGIDPAADLVHQVAEGVTDLAILHAPLLRPGLRAEPLFEERLVLVTTDPAGEATDYVRVDWGPAFNHRLATVQTEAPNPGLTVRFGPLALRYVLEAGGAGYFRLSAVKPHLASGRLHLVPGAAEVAYPVHAVFREKSEKNLVDLALAGLREVATA